MIGNAFGIDWSGGGVPAPEQRIADIFKTLGLGGSTSTPPSGSDMQKPLPAVNPGWSPNGDLSLGSTGIANQAPATNLGASAAAPTSSDDASILQAILGGSPDGATPGGNYAQPGSDQDSDFGLMLGLIQLLQALGIK